MLVLAARKKTARGLRRMLANRLGRDVPREVLHGDDPDVPLKGCLAVSLYGQMPASDRYLVDVVVVADVNEAGGNHAGYVLTCLLRPPRIFDAATAKRVYAFVRPGPAPGPATRLLREAVAGPVIYTKRPPPAQVRVRLCRAASLPPPPPPNPDWPASTPPSGTTPPATPWSPAPPPPWPAGTSRRCGGWG